MRQAALILGLIGGLLGLAGSFSAVFLIQTARNLAEMTGSSFGEYAESFGATNPATVESLAWLTLGCFAIDIVAAALTSANPGLAGGSMISVALVVLLLGIVTVTTGISAGFVGLAGIFALRSRNTNETNHYWLDVIKEWWAAGRRETDPEAPTISGDAVRSDGPPEKTDKDVLHTK